MSIKIRKKSKWCKTSFEEYIIIIAVQTLLWIEVALSSFHHEYWVIRRTEFESGDTIGWDSTSVFADTWTQSRKVDHRDTEVGHGEY